MKQVDIIGIPVYVNPAGGGTGVGGDWSVF